MMQTIAQVLVARDGYSVQEAEEAVEDFQNTIEDMMSNTEEDASLLLELEDELMLTFGLEPDYLMEVLPL
jgi:hypothetical protein